MFLYKSPIQLVNYVQASHDENINALLEVKEKPGVLNSILSKRIYDNSKKNKEKNIFAYIDKENYEFIALTFNIVFTKSEFTSDIFPLKDGFFLVSNKLRKIIENLDPNAHNFWKVKVKSNRDDTKDKDFQLMQIGRIFITDDFIPGLTPSKAIELISKKIKFNKQEVMEGPFFTVIGGGDYFFMSDDIINATLNKSIEGFWLVGSEEEKILGHPSLTKVL